MNDVILPAWYDLAWTAGAAVAVALLAWGLIAWGRTRFDSTASRALWFALICVVPVLGPLAFLASRPRSRPRPDRTAS